MRLKQGTELGLSQAMLCKYYKINSFICFPPYPAHASSRSSKSCYCMPLTVLVHNFCQNIPKLIAIIVFCGKGPHFCLCKPNKEIRMLKLFGLFDCLPLYKLSHAYSFQISWIIHAVIFLRSFTIAAFISRNQTFVERNL